METKHGHTAGEADSGHEPFELFRMSYLSELGGARAGLTRAWIPHYTYAGAFDIGFMRSRET